MGTNEPLTAGERTQIWAGYQQGQTIAQLAQTLHRSPTVVGKWWRRFRDQGWCEPAARGRLACGALGSFGPAVLAVAVVVKQAHSRWGVARVRVELQQSEALAGQPLPSRSRLAAAFRQACPAAVGVHRPRAAPAQAPPRAGAVHEVWQIDPQEKVVLGAGTWATVCNVRAPLGAALLASYAFSTQTAKRWRKPEVWTHMRLG